MEAKYICCNCRNEYTITSKKKIHRLPGNIPCVDDLCRGTCLRFDIYNNSQFVKDEPGGVEDNVKTERNVFDVMEHAFDVDPNLSGSVKPPRYGRW